MNVTVTVEVDDDEEEVPPIRFNDDGTITDTQLELVNLKSDHQWEKVGGPRVPSVVERSSISGKRFV